MTIGLIATIKVQAGKGADFEAVFTELAKAVRANEPGNLQYELFRASGEADTYYVFEQYKDAAALEAHGKAPHFAAAGPKLGPLLAGRPAILRADKVG